MQPSSPSSIEITDEITTKDEETSQSHQGGNRGTPRGRGIGPRGSTIGYSIGRGVYADNGRGGGFGVGRGRGGVKRFSDGNIDIGGRQGVSMTPGNRFDVPVPSRGRGVNIRGRAGGIGTNSFLDVQIQQKLDAFKGQQMKDLPPLDATEKKFNGRASLFVGSVAPSTTETQIKEMFSEYGEVGEIYKKSDKMFAFVRMGTRLEAEKAKRELDGQVKNGRTLRVKFSPHQGAIKVSNLGPMVTNELLYAGFSVLGDIERCIVFSDERGRSKEEGIVEFEKKGCAFEAVRRCSDGCFFLTASLRPVVAQIILQADDDDGFQEKTLPKHSHEYNVERELGPRFAKDGSFEFDYGTKWKALYELKRQKEEALKVEMKMEESKLIAQMEFSRYEHETEALREELRKKEAARDQLKSRWSIKEKYMEDIMKQEQEKQRSLEEGIFDRIQTPLQTHITPPQSQEENSLFMQAQEISKMLDQQESLMGIGKNLTMGQNLDDNVNDGYNYRPLPNEGTLDQLNLLANIQGESLGGGFGNLGNTDNDLGRLLTAEDLPDDLFEEYGSAKRRRI